MGSPPRVRGTAICHYFLQPPYRITPACAGNRYWWRFIWTRKRDHPRVCGEQLSEQLVKETGAGSPPRVRGTVQSTFTPPNEWGITPACAGNRVNHKDGNKKNKDHPRVCGEQARRYADLPGIFGSPPRVRGTVLHSLYRLLHGGITPACAGNSYF